MGGSPTAAERVRPAPSLRRVGALILLFAAVHAVWLTAQPASADTVRFVDNIAQLVGPLLGVPLCLWGRPIPLSARPPGGTYGWAAVFLALGCFSEALGQAIWTYYERVLNQVSPFPSWSDAAYLTLYPSLLLGILFLPARSIMVAIRLRLLLDGLMVMTVVAAFSWFFIVAPTILGSPDSVLAKIVGAAYPLADLLLIGCLLVLWTRTETAAARRAMWLLALALGIIITTDTIYQFQTLHSSYYTGELLDVGWPLGFLLVGLAAYALPMSDGTTSSPDDPLAAPAAPTILSTLLPFALVPLMGALILYVRHSGGSDSAALGVSIGAAALIVLLLVRQMLVLLENRRLYERLNAAFTAQGQGLALRVAELEWLRDASRQVTAARTLEDVLDVAYDAVRAGLGFDRVGINLFNHQDGSFEDWIGTDTAGQKFWSANRRVHLDPDSAIWQFPGIAAVLRGGDMYYTTDATRECPPSLRYLFDGEPTHNLMVSLRTGERAIGCISVDNLLSGRPILRQDARPLQALAHQVALAVERTWAEDALRASEERLRTVVETAPIILIILDRQGVCTLAAGGALGFLGLPAEGIIGMRIEAVFQGQPAITGGFAQALGGVASTATTERGDRTIELHWIPQCTADATVAGVIGVAFDVTERARRAAEELAMLRSDFVAAVSHELRTPLTGIIGYGELLQARWEVLDEAQRLDHTRRIVLSARRQQRLVEDLLLLSRMEVGGHRPRAEAFRLAAVARRAADEVLGSYREQPIRLGGPDDLQVLADPDHTLQIVVNLVDNAAKYSPDGAAIGICWGAEGVMAVLRVRDQGPGIPAQGRHLLFTRFGRVPGSRTRAGRVGTGLGLYLGRQMVEAMGGSLDLESTGVGGSVFCLCLPLVPDRAPRSGAPYPASEAGHPDLPELAGAVAGNQDGGEAIGGQPEG